MQILKVKDHKHFIEDQKTFSSVLFCAYLISQLFGGVYKNKSIIIIDLNNKNFESYLKLSRVQKQQTIIVCCFCTLDSFKYDSKFLLFKVFLNCCLISWFLVLVRAKCRALETCGKKNVSSALRLGLIYILLVLCDIRVCRCSTFDFLNVLMILVELSCMCTNFQLLLSRSSLHKQISYCCNLDASWLN